jgi:hypothetical protein
VRGKEVCADAQTTMPNCPRIPRCS